MQDTGGFIVDRSRGAASSEKSCRASQVPIISGKNLACQYGRYKRLGFDDSKLGKL